MKRYKTKIKFLTKDEIDRITAEAMKGKGERDHVLMQVLFCTGLRVSECVALKRADFDLQKYGVDETRELAIIGKGGWQRPIFFSPAVLKSISIYLSSRKDADPRLFPITKRTAQRIVKKYAKLAGLEATPHTFRHSLATHLLKNGANIFQVKEFLGHRALSSTQVYLHATNSELKELHEKLI